MTPPDLTNVVLGFTPVSYWIAGDYDPAALIEAMKAQSGLGDFADERGNMQSAVRLDNDPDGTPGYWASVPEGTPEATVTAGAAAYTPPS